MAIGRKKGGRIWRAVCVACVVAGSLAINGCGGGDDKTANGRPPLFPSPTPSPTPLPASVTQSFTVLWPAEADAAVGPLAQSVRSVRVRVTDESDAEVLSDKIFVRPAGGGAASLILPFPPSTGQMTATAYTSADGTGSPVLTAQAHLEFVSPDGYKTPVRLALEGTVREFHLGYLNSTQPLVPTFAVRVPTRFNATTYQEQGAIIMQPVGAIRWSVEPAQLSFVNDTGPGPGAAAVDENGVVTGTTPGGVKITATLPASDAGSEKTASVDAILTATTGNKK